MFERMEMLGYWSKVLLEGEKKKITQLEKQLILMPKSLRKGGGYWPRSPEVMRRNTPSQQWYPIENMDETLVQQDFPG